MDQNLVAAGFLLILAGFSIGLVSLLRSQGSHTGGPGGKRGGAVIIIGPIPIIFGSNPGIARMLLILSIILVIVLIEVFVLRLFP